MAHKKPQVLLVTVVILTQNAWRKVFGGQDVVAGNIIVRQRVPNSTQVKVLVWVVTIHYLH